VLAERFAEFVSQPGPSKSPIFVHRARRNAQHPGDLIDRQSAKKTKFDDTCRTFVQLSQTFDRTVDFEKLRDGGGAVLVRCRCIKITEPTDFASASLDRVSTTGVIDQNATDDRCRGGQKLLAIVDLQRFFPTSQTHKSLVHDLGRLHGVVAPFAVHVACRDLAQLVVKLGHDLGHMSFERRFWRASRAA